VVIDNNDGLPIPQKQELAKRLTQCLHPDFDMLHLRTLEVYEVIFERELKIMKIEERKCWGEDLGLFYSGLFNFYQFAAFAVKKKFLDIVQFKILLMEGELMLALPGFMICMMHALDDQNPDLTK
jgi:hypothetical protein